MKFFRDQTSPQICLFCRRTSSKSICTLCSAEIPLLPESGPAFCRRCGIPLLTGTRYCDSCRRTRKIFGDSTHPQNPHRPLALYQGLMREMISLYKFHSKTELAGYLAGMIHEVYQREFPGFHIIPVPPRAWKIYREGWDQIEYLCRSMERLYQLPVLRLLKPKGASEQKRKIRAERIAEPNRYHLKKGIEKRFRKPGRLLLIDDVYTTGKTLEACSEALSPLLRTGLAEELRTLSLAVVP